MASRLACRTAANPRRARPASTRTLASVRRVKAVGVMLGRAMPAGRRPLRLATRLEPGRYALYLTARSGSRHKEIRRILVVRS